MSQLVSILRRKPPAGRGARRKKRAARWAGPLDTPRRRFAAWASLLFEDHGVLRLVYRNRYRVSPRLWRSSQPAPADIRWAARRGIRTVVSLRNGQDIGAWPLQREACEQAGLALVVMPLFSRDPPSVDMLRHVADTFARIEYPALIHCKSGADRAGIAAALYLILQENAPASEARRQLGARYGHVRHGKTGVLDAFLRSFEATGERAQLSLMEWAETVYDREGVKRGFRSSRWGNLLTERILRRE